MAITIRTGANGSYKSAYTAYFSIYQALKAGKVVVTNMEGMQPLKVIEERFDIKFPSTSKLIRVSSRDNAGVNLWTHFFCWCPIGALIVIDECQDIFSKNIGFDMRKVSYKPVEDFISKDGGNDGLLPESYLSFFYSRYTPADMDALQESEIDDRGIAEYDEQGRIIYPHTFNEGFMRHRKYNWDIELLSPDWKQIDSGIKACGEQNFFHKGRDQFFWRKRDPLIWKHDKSVSTPVIPKTKDINITNKKIPLDSFLLYKSTGTGIAKQAGAMNTVFRSPKAIGIFLLAIFCMGYVAYEVSNRIISSNEEMEEAQTVQLESALLGEDSSSSESSVQSASGVRSSGGNHQRNLNGISEVVPIASILPFDGIKKAFVTGINFAHKNGASRIDLSLEILAEDGVYSLNERFLKTYDVNYEVIDACLLRLKRGQLSKLITCKPHTTSTVDAEISRANVQLF
ncbi:toxin [Vibrio sp. Isolate33]|uniref:zonular occludens toxin domain-containing protein n=1 Tax=Vibrio sp. Isolate33 TaxID=2908539 RepID=UPI001EFC32BE|nr:zonular occludens toxin domain-containing protein [Vibrio sp. Isolate33]MCG9544800.1 toxin [Vibrio sp. Isolate33]